MCRGSQARVRLTGPSASSSTQQLRLPSSSQVPSTMNPPGASSDCICRQAAATASSGYWRKTLKVCTSTGCSPASSKPPRTNSMVPLFAVCAALTRSGSISSPTTRRSGAPGAAAAPVPGSSPAAGRSPGRRPPVRRRTAVRTGSALTAPASGRRGAAGWRRWFLGSGCRPAPAPRKPSGMGGDPFGGVVALGGEQVLHGGGQPLDLAADERHLDPQLLLNSNWLPAPLAATPSCPAMSTGAWVIRAVYRPPARCLAGSNGSKCCSRITMNCPAPPGGRSRADPGRSRCGRNGPRYRRRRWRDA